MSTAVEQTSGGSKKRSKAGRSQPEATPGDGAAAMPDRMAAIEDQLQALEKLRPLLTSLQDQAERLEGIQRRTDVRVTRAGESADQIQSQIEKLGHSLDMALSLKRDLKGIEHLIPGTREHVDALGDLSSDVDRHVKAFEQRRQAVEQALETANCLNQVVERIEGVRERQREQDGTFGELDQRLRSLQAEVQERAADIRSRQLQIDAQDQATLEELAAIRTAVHKSLERVELFHGECDTVSQRVTDLRGQVDGLQSRFSSIQESQQTMVDVERQVEAARERLDAMTDGTGGLADLETRLTAIQSVQTGVAARAEDVSVRQDEIDGRSINALDHLTAIRERAEESAEGAEIAHRTVEKLMGETTDLRRVLEEFETRLGSVDASRQALSDLQAQTERVGQRLTDVVEGDRGIASLEANLAELQASYADVRERSEQVVEGQQRINGETEANRERLSGLRDDLQQTVERVADVTQSVGALDERFTGLGDETEDLARQLRGFDESRQRIAEVETKADTLAQRLEAIGDGEGGVAALEARVGSVQSVQAEVEIRSAEHLERQQAIEEDARATRERLEAVRADMGECAERIDGAKRDADATDGRLNVIHTQLEDFTARLQDLDESRRSITQVQHETGALSARLTDLDHEYERIDREAKKIRTVRAELDRIGDDVTAVAIRVSDLEDIRTQLDAVSRDMKGLRDTQHASARAIEEARGAHAEITRMRDGQTETQQWFARLEESLTELRERVDDLNETKAAVVSVREEAERVKDAVETIDARRELLEEMDRRLGELEHLGVRLADGPAAVDASARGAGAPVTGAGWFFAPALTTDRATWEFGLQVRCTGRWKRGVALWIGPVRAFLGWERRLVGPESGTDAEPSDHFEPRPGSPVPRTPGVSAEP